MGERSRRLGVLGILVALMVTVLFPGVVVAAGADEASTTTIATPPDPQVPPSSSAPPPSPPSSSAPPSSEAPQGPETSDAGPATSASTIADGADPAPGTPPVDPDVGSVFEALDADDSGVAITGYYASQAPFDPAVYNQVLSSSLAGAQATERLARQEVDRAHGALDAAHRQLGDIDYQVAALDEQRRAGVLVALRARNDVETQIREAYMRGGAPGVGASLITSGDATDYQVRRTLLGAVNEHSRAVHESHVEATAAIGTADRLLVDQRVELQRSVTRAEVAQEDALGALEVAEEQVRAYEAGSHVAVVGFVFPVVGDCEFIDSFGFPRNVGTSYEHWHEGTDLMARQGTPLVAVEGGVIERARSNRLGGIALRLRGDSGHAYYYAHLAGYAPGIEEGVRVVAGELVGFVGDTGDARGGPPHLHFEIRLPEGGVVNPYPLLRVAFAQGLVELPTGQDTPVPPNPQ